MTQRSHKIADRNGNACKDAQTDAFALIWWRLKVDKLNKQLNL